MPTYAQLLLLILPVFALVAVGVVLRRSVASTAAMVRGIRHQRADGLRRKENAIDVFDRTRG